MDIQLYKIGELAKLTGINHRTIDYYTKLGLIKPEIRSDSNYRYYGDETLHRLKRIELLKREKYTLEEIKAILNLWGKVSKKEEVTEKIAELQAHMHQLEKDLQEITPIIDNLKPSQIKKIFKLLTPESIACIEAILILLNRNPFM